MIAKPPTAHYQAFKKEMKRLEGAAAANAAAETAPPVACSIACQTEGGDPELLLPVACPTEDIQQQHQQHQQEIQQQIQQQQQPWEQHQQPLEQQTSRQRSGDGH